jgi:uncharacterized protein DUF4136
MIEGQHRCRAGRASSRALAAAVVWEARIPPHRRGYFDSDCAEHERKASHLCVEDVGKKIAAPCRGRRVMRRLAVLAVAAAALLVSGCATRIVSSHVELGTDFARYHTYDWGPADALPTGDARLDNNPFFRDYFQGAIEKELAAIPLELTSNDPDLLIHTHTDVTHRLDVDETPRGYPPCQGTDCSPTLVQYEITTLMIDLVDARTNKLVWRAWARDDMSAAIDDQQRLRRVVTEAVADMMKRLPKHL